MGRRVRLQISSGLAKTLIGLNAVEGKAWVPTMLEGRVFGILTPIPRWWFQFYFFHFFPYSWGNDPIWHQFFGGRLKHQPDERFQWNRLLQKMWLTELPSQFFLKKNVLNFILVNDTQLAYCSRLWHTEQTCEPRFPTLWLFMFLLKLSVPTPPAGVVFRKKKWRIAWEGLQKQIMWSFWYFLR